VRQEFFDKYRQSETGYARENKVETSGPDVDDELPLTAREREVFELVRAGKTNAENARILWVSALTVRTTGRPQRPEFWLCPGCVLEL